MNRISRLFALAVLILCFASVCTYAEDATPIYTKEELSNLRADGNYVLMNDIVFSEEDFKSGGIFYNNGAGWQTQFNLDYYQFNGTINGNGHVISGIRQNISSTSTKELFTSCFIGYNNGNIENLRLENCIINITKKQYDLTIGGLVANNNGTIRNSSFSGDVIFEEYGTTDTIRNIKFGGLAGVSNGTISHCYNEGNLMVDFTSIYHSGADRYLGGIVGKNLNSGIIEACYNSGQLEFSGNATRTISIGGIAGQSYGIIDNCFNVSDIKGTHSNGIAHTVSDGEIRNCYNIGVMTDANQPFGAWNTVYPKYDNNVFLSTEEQGPIINDNKTLGTYVDLSSILSSEAYFTFDFENTWYFNESKYCIPTIKGLPVPELRKKSITIGDSYSIAENETLKLSAIAEDTTLPVVWDSGDESIATVDSSGNISVVKAGIVTITATNPLYDASDSCEIIINHVFGDWTVTKEASCTIPGERQSSCEYCGNSLHEEIPPTGHGYGPWATTKNPACETPGEKQRTCENCGDTDIDEIAPNGHTFDEGRVTKESTCSEHGIMTYFCTVGGCYASKTEELPTTDHTWMEEYTIDKEPTCYDTGIKSHHCKYCKAISDAEILDKIEHEYIHVVIPAKIGITGRTYDECIYCKETINNKTLPALKPNTTNIKSLTKATKAFTVKWTKKSYTGYQIQYSLKSSMASAKNVYVTKSSTVSKKISKLKSKKKYYVRIRTYKTVNGKKVFSNWSVKKSITTK